MFRVYSGPQGSKLGPLDKSRHLFKSFATLDEAIGWAHKVSRNGQSAMLIEGDDGTHLDHADLAKALKHRSGEHSARL
ncbi:MAG: hypothetical protein M5U33_05590 [Pseudorhodoplanes sp.]|nr:hypothetical protein [Pseudorhodoplanes sp.]MBW7949408.1 hypothetical protein [Pseudorhodoplanes sp.]MCL4710726.1 hypothetical protein [Pseudorhodoplanes sp.]MCZ7642296.1 hypothetical protein [Pseudorhodoplanes sp.]GIK82260.1 MAG: hypothetical protein BroJett024_33650 [Alphaproteobacteria bacterium]